MSNSRYLITGGTGLVGTALSKLYPEARCISSSDCDLTDERETRSLFKTFRPTHVFHLAAKVGGVYDNKTNVEQYYYDNMKINLNTLKASEEFGVEKVVSLLSTCIYPDKPAYPLREETIHDGPPHSSNFGYAYAKRMLDIHSRAARQQKGLNFVCAVPNNIFGINDNFDAISSHVIPGMIRKIYESKCAEKSVTLWGDGSPVREFTCSDDIARALREVMERYQDDLPINIGNTNSISIKDLAKKICKNFNYTGDIIWDINMPNGQLKKPSSNDRFLKLSNFKYSNFDQELSKVCKWFEERYPNNIRGVQYDRYKL